MLSRLIVLLRLFLFLTAGFTALLLVAGCESPLSPPSPLASPAPTGPKTLRVLTHASFAVSPELIAEFEAANQVKLQFIAGGDAGETLNKAILTQANPLADVIYGVDNTFLSRAIAADLCEPYPAPALADVPAELQLDPQNRFLPVDVGYVNLNYDKKFFREKGLAVPATLAALTQPEYKGLMVTENPATSSPGLAFLIATVSYFGETGEYTWESFWQDLRRNDLLVVNGWNEAYYQEFSGAGKGQRPLVVSYATSPAAELFFAQEPKPAEPPTGNIQPAGSVFRQVEFVGILKGSKEPKLARQFVDFLLGRGFQEDMPLQMFVYPANRQAAMPDLFRSFAPPPIDRVDRTDRVGGGPSLTTPAAIAEKRDGWIRRWTEIVLR